MAVIGVTSDYYDPVLGWVSGDRPQSGEAGERGGGGAPVIDVGPPVGGGGADAVVTGFESDTGKKRATAPGDTSALDEIARQQAESILKSTNQGYGAGGYPGAGNTNTAAGLEEIARQQAAAIFKNTNQGYGAGAYAGGGFTNPTEAKQAPTLPDMPPPAAAAGGGPAALAVGEGWYIGADGQFRSINDGANIRANRLNATQGYSIGPDTIVDTGASRTANPFADLTTAGDITSAGRRLPGGLGLPGMYPTLADMPPPNPPAGGGAASALGAPGYANYNPRLDTTVAQTYGTPTGTVVTGGGGGGVGYAAGAPELPPGFRQGEAARIVYGPDGTMYITDAGPNGGRGFLNPDLQRARDWQSRANIDVNATTGFSPFAIEALRYLDSVGRTTPEEKRALALIDSSPLGPQGYTAAPAYSDWLTRHNAEAQRLGLSGQQLDNPTRTLPINQVFPVYDEYAKLLSDLGATEIQFRRDNHTTYKVGDKSPIMQWRTASGNTYALTGDTPFANVLDDVAKLRALAASQNAAAANAAAGGGGGGRGYGGYSYGAGAGGGGGGGGGAGAPAPWWSGTPGGRLYANNPQMLNNYINSPSYDAVNIAQAAPQRLPFGGANVGGGGLAFTPPPLPGGVAGGVAVPPSALGAGGIPGIDPTAGTGIVRTGLGNYVGDPRVGLGNYLPPAAAVEGSGGQTGAGYGGLDLNTPVRPTYNDPSLNDVFNPPPITLNPNRPPLFP